MPYKTITEKNIDLITQSVTWRYGQAPAAGGKEACWAARLISIELVADFTINHGKIVNG